MFENLADADPPETGPQVLDAVLRRAGHIRRRRRIVAGSASISATCSLLSPSRFAYVLLGRPNRTTTVSSHTRIGLLRR